ncbi:YDG/SRA domain-containing protein [Kitasatospora sp. NPDC001527]|uniref:YDG/SRA domain-containing protein n=1 Tax=Kitasatospora sp. NPDC001527 TaxID=3154519 RepID=UPI00331F4DE9
MVQASRTDEICAAIDALRVDRSSGQPARHQPIVLLWAIGRAASGRSRLTAWEEVHEDLGRALEAYGRPGSDPSPEYPFVALSRSGLWELKGFTGDVPTARGSALKHWVQEQNPRGGLSQHVYKLMATDPEARQRVIDQLLNRFFDTADADEPLTTGLANLVFDGFGPVPGVAIGQVFSSRRELYDANVHRQLQAGISGTKDRGAESIVASGGYEDDEDLGNVIIYTGQGGRNDSGQQIADQELTLGNAALMTSRTTGMPVRVVRGVRKAGSASAMDYRYDGLFHVEDAWCEPGQSNYLVWRFRLVQLMKAEAPFQTALPRPRIPAGNEAPSRVESIAKRIVRSTQVANFVKQVHDFHCQVCGLRLTSPTRPYAEAAHIQALGKPHNGPDLAANVLCLCPNHHTLFDFGMLLIDDDLKVTDRSSGTVIGRLREVPDHQIDRAYLAYHRDHHSGAGWHGPVDE